MNERQSHSLERHKENQNLIRENFRLVRRLISGALPRKLAESLRTLTQEFNFSLNAGELQIINAIWYVTHTGLLRLARRKRCRGIHVEAVDSLCDSAANRFVLKATVYPSKDSAGFVGYGDADPSNVSLLVRGAEMRIAETRAVNRALRKAYGIGICSVEEIGSNPGPMPAGSRCTEVSAQEYQRKRQRFRSQGPRSALPDHSPAQARSRAGESLRRRLLRYQSPQRRHSRAGRKLRPAACRGGQEGPQCPALPAQQLRTAQARRWRDETSCSRTLRDRA